MQKRRREGAHQLRWIMQTISRMHDAAMYGLRRHVIFIWSGLCELWITWIFSAATYCHRRQHIISGSDTKIPNMDSLLVNLTACLRAVLVSPGCCTGVEMTFCSRLWVLLQSCYCFSRWSLSGNRAYDVSRSLIGVIETLLKKSKRKEASQVAARKFIVTDASFICDCCT